MRHLAARRRPRRCHALGFRPPHRCRQTQKVFFRTFLPNEPETHPPRRKTAMISVREAQPEKSTCAPPDRRTPPQNTPCLSTTSTKSSTRDTSRISRRRELRINPVLPKNEPLLEIQIMWAELTHPRHVEFYREFHEGRLARDEDWMPMVRAVEYLRSQDYAAELFAFTSHAHFQVTTAPSYSEHQAHSCVGISWHFRNRLFGMSFRERDRPNGDCQNDIIRCTENEFPSAVDALILRLGHS
jgi:hypothetical protein